jgi:hypothetical protein
MENVEFYQNRFFNYILVQKRRERFTKGKKEAIFEKRPKNAWRLMDG